MNRGPAQRGIAVGGGAQDLLQTLQGPGGSTVYGAPLQRAELWRAQRFPGLAAWWARQQAAIEAESQAWIAVPSVATSAQSGRRADSSIEKAALALKGGAGHSIRAICEIVEILRNTYYKYTRGG